MSNTQKPLSDRDMQHAIRGAFTEVDKSLSVSSFLVGKVGRKVVQTVTTTTVADDTLIFDYQENTVSLYQIKIIYTDGTRATLLSAERIS